MGGPGQLLLDRLVVRPLTEAHQAWEDTGLLGVPWINKTIRRGYALQFARRPPPFRGILRTTVCSSHESAALLGEVSSLLQRGAIVEVEPHRAGAGFYSPYFLVPKKNGGVRPILDLRILNSSIAKRPFRMLTIQQLLQCISPGDWMTSVDLLDAYFHIPIVPEHRKFLRFAIGGRCFEYCRLPFGYSLAPRTFTKCVEAALEPLRRQGLRILTCIDDWLILAASQGRP